MGENRKTSQGVDERMQEEMMGGRMMCVMDQNETVIQVFVSVTGEREFTCGPSGDCFLLVTSVRSEMFLLWPRAKTCNTEN